MWGFLQRALFRTIDVPRKGISTIFVNTGLNIQLKKFNPKFNSFEGAKRSESQRRKLLDLTFLHTLSQKFNPLQEGYVGTQYKRRRAGVQLELNFKFNQEILQKDATQNSTQRGQKRGHHTQDKPGHSDTLGAETTKTKTKQP